MTREESIRELKIEFLGEYDRQREAKNLAIKALEQEQYYKDLAESYEKTINKLTKAIAEQEPKTDILDKIRAEIEQTVDEERIHDEKWSIGLRYAVKIIDKYREEG